MSHDGNENDGMIPDDVNHTHNSMDLFHKREDEYLETSPQLMLSGGLEHSPILLEHVEEEMEEEGKGNLEIFNDSLLTQGTQTTPILEVKGPEADAFTCISSSQLTFLLALNHLWNTRIRLFVAVPAIAVRSDTSTPNPVPIIMQWLAKGVNIFKTAALVSFLPNSRT